MFHGVTAYQRSSVSRMTDAVHEFAVFQEVGGKILPVYGPAVRLDLREVFNFGSCDGVFGGRASCTRVIMNDGSVYALDVPEEAFRAMIDAVE
ncbi:hypothetical protein JL100_035800 (plasmid) [Skermanella mucosa]|uniref:hypothetical protein n=1 Tax=Skermanella mucosa TaxID=1789672 RepID=UPI00192B9CB6|nr:hypothetical protein [Skermanella mucosa]UEM25149.1 hypothetical protein JL100_035800 [Skermanella mucosa]